MSFEKMFAQWKEEHRINAFISDEIVDVKNYEEPHVLFILRDMNCEEERDLCKDLRSDGSGWKTWNNIGRWTKALLDGNEIYPRDMSKTNRIAQLRRIAVLNLKKEGGRNRTKGNELLQSVQEQHKEIYDEICLCDPQIIICCGLSASGIIGNATLLKEYVFPNSTEWSSVKSPYFDREWSCYFTDINNRRVPVISYCHPQVTLLEKKRGHENLFEPLYRDMLLIRKLFLENRKNFKIRWRLPRIKATLSIRSSR